MKQWVINRLAPAQRSGINTLLNGIPYEGDARWSLSLNAPAQWLGAPFRGFLESGYDEWRLLLGRWRIRRRRVTVAVFVGGHDPMMHLLDSSMAERREEAV